MPMYSSQKSDYSLGESGEGRPRSRPTPGKSTHFSSFYPDNNLLITGSRPTSRSGSRGPSRNGSRPASRAYSISDLSAESIEGLSQRKLGVSPSSGPRFSTTATGLRRTPSEGTGILGKERWKWQEASTSASSSSRVNVDNTVSAMNSPSRTMTRTTMTVRLEERLCRNISLNSINVDDEDKQWD